MSRNIMMVLFLSVLHFSLLITSPCECKMKYFRPLTLYQELLNLHPSKRGRLLGLSVGNDAVFSRCVGVAVSDSNNEVASPVSVMERKKDNIYQMASALEDLLEDHSVSAVIVGYRKDPWDLKKITKNKAIIGLPKDPWDNTELFKFLEDLYKAGKFQQVPYTYWEEEDLYYKRVTCMLNPFHFDRRLAIMLRDKKYCASEMLQNYLNEMKHTMTEQAHEHHSHLEG